MEQISIIIILVNTLGVKTLSLNVFSRRHKESISLEAKKQSIPQ